MDFETQFLSGPLLCYWPGYDPDAQVNPSLCTHISYAFYSIDDSGAIAQEYGNFAKFLSFKTTNPSVKLLISIGGYSDQDKFAKSFSTVARDYTKRNNFVNNVFNVIQSNGLDGGKK